MHAAPDARMEADAGARAAPRHVGGRDRGSWQTTRTRSTPSSTPAAVIQHLGSGRRAAQEPGIAVSGAAHAQAAQRPARGRVEGRRRDPQAVPGADAAARRDPAGVAVAAGLSSAGRGGRRHQGGDAGDTCSPAGAGSADVVEQARQQGASRRDAALHPASAGSRPGGSRHW